MRKSIKGFTLVELLVVCTVIVILSLIATLSYLGYQKQSQTAAADSMAQSIGQALEKYYRTNGIYPLDTTLTGGSGIDGTTMTNYSSAGAALNISANNFTTGQWTFAPCITAAGGVCTASNTSKVYYLTRFNNDTVARTYNVGTSPTSCVVTFEATSSNIDNGSTSYVLAYYSPQANQWVLYGSHNANDNTSSHNPYYAITSGSGCTLSTN